MQFSIIVPVLDEAGMIQAHLQALQPLRTISQILVVDGGSTDQTTALAKPLADKITQAPKGRARQMNAGAEQAKGDILVFLHADTSLPENALSTIAEAMTGDACWGRFDISLAGSHPMLPVIAFMMNLRSRMTGIATGDQTLFITREAFIQAGGFPDIPLMEDIALSKTLQRFSRPACLRTRVSSSGRRWETLGVGRTILLMWWLRLLYFFGTDPAYLAQLYKGGVFWKH